VNSPQNFCFYEFEGFVLDPAQRVLRSLADGQTVRLSARAFDALHMLVERHGQLVDKETLIKALWPKVVVEENNLTQVIHALRQSLGEKPGEHRFIATAPGRGYQFVAAVKEVSRAPATSGPVPTGSSNDVTDRVAIELAGTEKAHAGGSSSRWSLLRLSALSLALLLAASAWWVLQRNGAASTTSAQQSAAVAVLPFVNLTGDPTREYLGDGMAEELINTLAKVPGLKVPARTSSFSYKGRNVDARQIAKELGVGMIVEGSVRSAGDQIRITAQLINAEDGLHLWSETYDERFTDIFSLQDKLAKAIATALHANLSSDGVATIASKPPTQDIEAYRLYLQGTALLERPTLPNVERALDFFQRAITRDAQFARAYEGSARGYVFLAPVRLCRWTLSQLRR
jgi:TolB-like protein/DNA-binding winged helix-turn-helix (wHTH) protein